MHLDILLIRIFPSRIFSRQSGSSFQGFADLFMEKHVEPWMGQCNVCFCSWRTLVKDLTVLINHKDFSPHIGFRLSKIASNHGNKSSPEVVNRKWVKSNIWMLSADDIKGYNKAAAIQNVITTHITQCCTAAKKMFQYKPVKLLQSFLLYDEGQLPGQLLCCSCRCCYALNKVKLSLRSCQARCHSCFCKSSPSSCSEAAAIHWADYLCWTCS